MCTQVCALTHEALSLLNSPTSPGGPEEEVGPSPLPAARSCWPGSTGRWCSCWCSCCRCSSTTLPASAECWLLDSTSSCSSCLWRCEVAGCSSVSVDALAFERALLVSVHCGWSLLLHRPRVGTSSSMVVLTALCWDCTSRGRVSLSCRMLLMVATQARKAETRQGSRKGLQAGEWQIRSIHKSPVWRAVQRHRMPHSWSSSTARRACHSTRAW